MTALIFSSRLLEAADQVMKRLHADSLTLVTAESCTAGLLAALFSSVKGAGECLQGGFITYTKAQKTIALGVSADQLRVTGAVTPEVAAGMAYGGLSQSTADIAIGVTGVLGPMPDEDGNPVGLVYLAIRDRSGFQEVARKEFGALKHEVLAELTLAAALELLASYLLRYEATLPTYSEMPVDYDNGRPSAALMLNSSAVLIRSS